MTERTETAAKLATASSNQQALNEVAAALEGLKFGHVELTIHDGRVVQLDVTEKKRFAGN